MNSKRKGNSGERELLRILKSQGIEARRNDQTYKCGVDNPDISAIIANLPVHIEVKRTERFNLYEAMEQAVHDANGHAIPIVAHRRNNKPWCICILLDDFLKNTQGGTK